MNTKKKKRNYSKPKLKAINLAAEEVLGVACKTSTSTGAPHLNSFSCIGSGCHRLGS